jgi:hypothetical protein
MSEPAQYRDILGQRRQFFESNPIPCRARRLKKLFAAMFVSLMLVSGSTIAVPSATQIETAIHQGNWQ